MEIAFATKQLRTICENKARARIELGELAAEALTHRLADLDAASTICDLVVPNTVGHTSSLNELLSLKLAGSVHLLISANHNDVPRHEGGKVDWKRVVRVKIEGIGEIND